MPTRYVSFGREYEGGHEQPDEYNTDNHPLNARRYTSSSLFGITLRDRLLSLWRRVSAAGPFVTNHRRAT